MKKTTKKLALHRETLLTNKQLDGVAGGSIVLTCTCTWGCPSPSAQLTYCCVFKA